MTRTNPEKYKTLIFDEDFSTEKFSKSAFNATADTKVYIHGYLSRGTKNYILAMKDAFLQAGLKTYKWSNNRQQKFDSKITLDFLR